MIECPYCKNSDQNKYTRVRLEAGFGVRRIKALLCLVCGLVFVDKEELDKYTTYYYK